MHTPADRAGDSPTPSGPPRTEARRLLFGATPVVFPMEIAVVDRYADAK